MNKISLIVPVYNDWENVIDFIGDIVRQKSIPEVVFAIHSDDEKDPTESIVKGYGSYPEIKFVRVYLRGTGIAINKAFGKTTGQFIMVANADFRFDSKDAFSDMEAILTQKMDVVKVMRVPGPRKDLSIIQNCIRLWDVRASGYASFTFIRRDLFPEYPEISYGEDKIAWQKIRQKNPTYFQIIKDYGFERGNYKNFDLRKFIKRYLWYGSTYKDYAREAGKIKGEPAQHSYLPFIVLKPFLAMIAFVSMKVGRLRG